MSRSGEFGVRWFTLNYHFNGVPSGPCATSSAVASVLCVIAPGGRLCRMAAALVVGVARIPAGAHFLGDLIVDSYLGALSGVPACR